MEALKVIIAGISIPVYSMNTAVVGSGAAGLNAAERLFTFGQKDVAIITEGINMGTSRNTGSDKQTYYKMTLAGDTPDSVQQMANTLYEGGSMDGDIALVEAALSSQCFYHLVEIGVPFPHNRFGEYIGYKTDHDPRQRATSVGPLTSKFMTEKLEQQVKAKGIHIFDGFQVIGILTDESRQNALGLLALDLNGIKEHNTRYALFNCTNIIYATGGPAGLYNYSVYPESQTGSTGIALEAGVKAKNLTEWQYGLASVKFRWNLSGTYQQVLPRYVSADKDLNDEKEFLTEYFDTVGGMFDAIFLKGYQWPFDPRKVLNFGSSLIDILVYNETVLKDRRVFLDFIHNPASNPDGGLDFRKLGKEAYLYLERSNALFGTPIERLAHMNVPAIELYKNNGIDLAKEYLEIAVCAQHNNGGLEGNSWWESNLRHFFPVGEVNGTHGVYRPGGSALNSGQVGSFRAAQYIASRYSQKPMQVDEFVQQIKVSVEEKIAIGESFAGNLSDVENVSEIRSRIGERTSKYGAHIRSSGGVRIALEEVKSELETIVNDTKSSDLAQISKAFQNRDLLIAQKALLSAIADYIEKGGKSRGSYLVQAEDGELPLNSLPDDFRFMLREKNHEENPIQVLSYLDGECICEWRKARPIPKCDDWFENVWNEYRKDEIIK